MSYKLYYSPGACSLAVHTLLHELDQQVDLIKTDTKNKSPEFLKINPRGAVPVLVTPNDQVIREGAAIMIWLCDFHQSQLLPTKSDQRAPALEWLMMANSTLHPYYSTMFNMMGRNIDAPEVKQYVVEKMQKCWDEVEAQLSKTNAYICGENATVADILLTVIGNWNNALGNPVIYGPNCKRLFETISNRASFKKSLEHEGVEYKAAA
jgi:glutathione S-transferase